ncbi:hypothetical protein AFLA_005827 [Aspergillus flavus NRRL3357]|nr:hypothetical protein AFLA_005827 [Aspergillus flavus NRRL3357]
MDRLLTDENEAVHILTALLDRGGVSCNTFSQVLVQPTFSFPTFSGFKWRIQSTALLSVYRIKSTLRG